MRLGDWYRRKSAAIAASQGFVWDVSPGRIELRSYNSTSANQGPMKYILTPAQLADGWTLERKNDSGQIVNPRFLEATVGQTPDDN